MFIPVFNENTKHPFSFWLSYPFWNLYSFFLTPWGQCASLLAWSSALLTPLTFLVCMTKTSDESHLRKQEFTRVPSLGVPSSVAVKTWQQGCKAVVTVCQAAESSECWRLAPFLPSVQFRNKHGTMLVIYRLGLPLQLNLSANVLAEYPEAGLLGDSKLCHNNNDSCVLWLSHHTLPFNQISHKMSSSLGEE